MQINPAYIGVAIALLASYMNYRISKRYSMLSDDRSAMAIWYGWLTATTLRFFSIIFAGLYIVSADYSESEKIEFIISLLIIIISGLILDFCISLFRVSKSHGKPDKKALGI